MSLRTTTSPTCRSWSTPPCSWPRPSSRAIASQRSPDPPPTTIPLRNQVYLRERLKMNHHKMTI
ncbi:hypothetical protein V2J09_000619 [Rumex salicifolius]